MPADARAVGHHGLGLPGRGARAPGAEPLFAFLVRPPDAPPNLEDERDRDYRRFVWNNLVQRPLAAIIARGFNIVVNETAARRRTGRTADPTWPQGRRRKRTTGLEPATFGLGSQASFLLRLAESSEHAVTVRCARCVGSGTCRSLRPR